ncbi:MAG: hypothetical protein ACOWWM_16605 [Desulfobacterales bacterium]
MIRFLLTILAWLAAGTVSVSLAAYDYPFINPYEATVVGTPDFYSPELTEFPPVKTYTIPVSPDRKIPDVFWYTRGFRFSLVRQGQPAPLIFIIAGTGSSHESSTMQMLQKAFYDAGFHVLSLPSPTHPNFIVNASKSCVPGHLMEDSEDLYEVMQLAYDRVRRRIDVTAFHLTGYSLGGAQAAAVSRLDAEQRRFGFEKVLLINPPVSLFNSAGVLDRMLESNLEMEPSAVNRFFGRYMDLFSNIYQRSDTLKFDENFLYNIYRNYPQREEDLAVMIGLSFRNAATSMIFVADVMSHAGFVVPPGKELGPTDSLTGYFKVLMQTGFIDYIGEFFLPYFIQRNPDLTMDDLLDRVSLRMLEPYLREADHIGLLHNEDDLILAPGELEYLRSVFGDRAKIYPTGGHLGNLAHRAVLNHMIDYFRN